MARSRKFRTTRHLATSERSLFEQKLTGRYSRTLDRTDLLNLIRGGEDTYLEFKIRLVNVDKITAEIVALANSGGGVLVFGVNDQRRLEGLDDPEDVEEQLIDICRNRIKPALLPRIDKVWFEGGIRVVVLQVDDRRAPYSTPDNRYFIRIGSTKRETDGAEIAELFARSHTAFFEDLPVLGATIEEIDEALIWSYIRDLDGETFREPPGFPTAQALRDLGLARDLGAVFTPTLGGFLLFGRSGAVRQRVPHSGVTLSRLSGADLRSPVVERVEFHGNIGSLYDRSMSFVKRYVDLWDSRPPRTVTSRTTEPATDPVPARSNYPRQAVAEALINMLVHRNYSMTGSGSRILIFDDRMEFINPARSGDAVKPSIEYGVAPRPNPKLHHIFTSSEFGAEQIARGIPRLRRTHYSFCKREPRISLLGDEFRLELIGI
ncbi:MAG TPA: RNA-binding domain-containing protein [Blastocatellia bacterium]